MNGKERVLAVVNGKEVDRLPFGFWYHFPPESYEDSEATIKHHIDYYNATKPDLFKIMNENIFPYTVPIRTVSDLFSIKSVKREADWIKEQAEITKRIADELKDDAPFVFMTLHGIIASTWHARGGSDGYSEGSLLLQRFLREDVKAMEHVFKVIEEAMSYLVDAVKGSGIDGIYYSALGGESYLFTDEEYEQYIKPYDNSLYSYIQENFPNSALHICKDKINAERFKDLNPKMINWGENQDNPKIELAKEIWPNSTLIAGFDNSKGSLINGSSHEIEDDIKNLIERFQGKNFILGADCTLPMDIDWEQINKVREVLEKMD